MLSQVLLKAFCLVVWVIGFFPGSKVLAADAFVLWLPRNQAFGTRHGSAVRTNQLLVFGIS